MLNNKILTIGLCSICAYTSIHAKEVQRPNIIVIYTDDQRFDSMSENGNTVIQTPNLDAFFSQAFQFTNANPAFSLSSPSRAAMLTGRYGSANGVLNLDSKLNAGEKSVAQYLHDQGYYTGVSGKWHVKPFPQDLGFDYHCYFYSNGTYYGREIHDMDSIVKSQEHCDSYCAKKSAQFIKDHANGSKPFFLFHCTQLPHMNNKLIWDAKEETKNRYNVEDMPCPKSCNDDLSGKPEYLKTVRNHTQAKKYGYPDTLAIKKHCRDYYSVITEMDDFLSVIFDELKRDNLLDNTYVFLMGDNGWMIGEHGMTSKVLPYAASTRVPFLVTGPGIKKEINNSYVSNIDLAPTIMEIAGIDVPDNIHGKSLVPILKDKKKSVRKNFVYEGLGTYGGSMHNLTVLSNKYRYIVTYSDKSLQHICFEELYDVAKDSDEMINLANDKSYAKVIKSLKSDIENHKRKVLNKK